MSFSVSSVSWCFLWSPWLFQLHCIAGWGVGTKGKGCQMSILIPAVRILHSALKARNIQDWTDSLDTHFISSSTSSLALVTPCMFPFLFTVCLRSCVVGKCYQVSLLGTISFYYWGQIVKLLFFYTILVHLSCSGSWCILHCLFCSLYSTWNFGPFFKWRDHLYTPLPSAKPPYA